MILDPRWVKNGFTQARRDERMTYPGFREAAGAEDDAVYQKILSGIPTGRLGEAREAAHFTMSLLDGYNMFTTGNFFPVAGGFNNEGMKPFGK